MDAIVYDALEDVFGALDQQPTLYSRDHRSRDKVYPRGNIKVVVMINHVNTIEM